MRHKNVIFKKINITKYKLRKEDNNVKLRRRRLGHFISTHYTQQCPASLDGEGLEQQETNCTKM